MQETVVGRERQVERKGFVGVAPAIAREIITHSGEHPERFLGAPEFMGALPEKKKPQTEILVSADPFGPVPCTMEELMVLAEKGGRIEFWAEISEIPEPTVDGKPTKFWLWTRWGYRTVYPGAS